MHAIDALQDMGTSFTIRLPESQREALRRRAKAMKSSESAWVRHIIEKDLQASTLQEQLGDLIGSLNSAEGSASAKGNPLKATIRERNWRP
jgi:hypothetical protein